MARSNIPLKMYGMVVGTARINDDGTIDNIMDSPCNFGKDWLVQFDNGEFDSLTIMPSGQPMTPTPAPFPEG